MYEFLRKTVLSWTERMYGQEAIPEVPEDIQDSSQFLDLAVP